MTRYFDLYTEQIFTLEEIRAQYEANNGGFSSFSSYLDECINNACSLEEINDSWFQTLKEDKTPHRLDFDLTSNYIAEKSFHSGLNVTIYITEESFDGGLYVTIYDSVEDMKQGKNGKTYNYQMSLDDAVMDKYSCRVAIDGIYYYFG